MRRSLAVGSEEGEENLFRHGVGLCAFGKKGGADPEGTGEGRSSLSCCGPPGLGQMTLTFILVAVS